MSSRDVILGRIRSALGHAGADARRAAVAERIAAAPAGIIPARGRLDRAGRIALFREQAEKVQAKTSLVRRPEEVLDAITGWLAELQVPRSVRVGGDPRIAVLPWETRPDIEVLNGPAKGSDAVGFAAAFAAVAETGSVFFASGPDNPTTNNFLPENHVVLIDADDIAGDYETALAKVRDRYGKGVMPRALNMITGPSRTADIEQLLLYGAHGPRRVHHIIIDRS